MAKQAHKVNKKIAIESAHNLGYSLIKERVSNSAHILMTFAYPGGSNIQVTVSANQNVKPSQIQRDILMAHNRFNSGV